LGEKATLVYLTPSQHRMLSLCSVIHVSSSSKNRHKNRPTFYQAALMLHFLDETKKPPELGGLYDLLRFSRRS